MSNMLFQVSQRFKVRYRLWPQVNIKVGEDGVQNGEETRQNFKHFTVNVKWKERSHQIAKAS